MRAVYKYKLTTAETQTIKMPYKAKIVHVGTQWMNEENDHMICLWAEIDADYLDDLEDRRFNIVGTGHIITGGGNSVHVGTVQMPQNVWGNVFVWHVYEVPNDV